MKMKRFFMMTGSISAISLALAANLQAQDQSSSSDTSREAAQSPQGQRPQPQSAGQQSTSQETADASSGKKLQNLGKASNLIGMDVKNQQGELLGEVSDIAVDLTSGRIAYVVVDAGAYLDSSGLEEVLVAVPPQAFTVSEGGLVLNADKDRLQRAPTFSESELPSPDSPNWGASYWGASAGRQTLSGRVVDIDADKGTVTVEGSNGRQVFAIDPDATFEFSDRPDADLSDLQSGEQVIVIFSPQPDGSVIAYTIRGPKPE